MRDPRPYQVSVSYASSEIIVGIIVIAEKCSSGFVLITQVRARFRVKGEDQGRSAAITRTCPGNNSMLPIHFTLVNHFTQPEAHIMVYGNTPTAMTITRATPWR